MRVLPYMPGYVTGEVVLPVPCEQFFSKGKEKNFLVVVVASGQRSESERVLQAAGIPGIPVSDQTGAPQARIDYYTGQIADLAKQIADINGKLDAVRRQHAGFLVACEFAKAEVEKTEAPLRFADHKADLRRGRLDPHGQG